MDSLLFLADALDSVQMDDSAFRDSVELGVLYSCVLPGSGNIVGGRSAIIRNYARTTTEALIARSGIKAAFGYNPMSTRDWKGTRPHTRMGALSLLRARLAQVKTQDGGRPPQGGKSGGGLRRLTAEDEVIALILLGSRACACTCTRSTTSPASCACRRSSASASRWTTPAT